MRILLCNDDGYHAPGFQQLIAALEPEHDLTVYAPAMNQSGVSHALTLGKPIKVVQQCAQRWIVYGTPADAVHVALSREPEPDVVISGINSGPNLGCDVLYSGTVAAAMEARFLGKPTMAVSQCFAAEAARASTGTFATACEVVKALLENTASWSFSSMSVLNVNVPEHPLRDADGGLIYEWTRLGQRGAPEPAFLDKVQTGVAGMRNYRVGSLGVATDATAGTDFAAVSAGRVSLTPLIADLTATEVLDQAHEERVGSLGNF